MKIFINKFEIIFLLLILAYGPLYASMEKDLVSERGSCAAAVSQSTWCLPKELIDTNFNTSSKDGTALTIRRIKEKDITEDFIAKSYQSDPMIQLSGQKLPTVTQARASLEDYNKPFLDEFPLGIFNLETNEYLGYLELRVGRNLSHYIELSIKICSSQERRRGIGASTMQALADYLIKTVELYPEWGIEGLEGNVNPSNAAALAMMKKLGIELTEQSSDVFFYRVPFKKPVK